MHVAKCKGAFNNYVDTQGGRVGWFKSGQNDKLYIFLLFWPDSETFGKWCLEKCKKIFDSTTLMPAESVPKFYVLHNAPM